MSTGSAMFDPTEQFTRLNSDVYIAKHPDIVVGTECLEWLEQAALGNASKKCRICLHNKHESEIQEMIIAYAKGVNLPLHRQKGKTVSYSVLKGELALNLYDENGGKKESLFMSADSVNGARVIRVDASRFRNMDLKSDSVVFHELTAGPYREAETDWL